MIVTVFEAVEFLTQWPADRSNENRLAMRHCLDAMDGICRSRHAYLAFVDAAKAAGMTVAD